MPKLYLTNNQENEYYTYTNNSDKPVYLTLKDEEVEAYLKKITSHNLKSARSINANLIEVITEEDEIIVIDSIKVFNKDDKFASYLDKLKTTIKENLEKSNITTYKQSLPNDYIPKVKRGPKKAKYMVEDNS